MARRGSIEVALRAAPFVGVAILCHALAFIVWDVGTRPPAKLARDIIASFSSPRALLKGSWRLVFGWLVLLVGAILILSVTIDEIRTEFTVLETLAVVGGLIIEALIGEPIRAQLLHR